MTNIVTLSPAVTGGLIRSEGAAAMLKVARSRAWYELRAGARDAAGRFAIAIATDLPIALAECEAKLAPTDAETVTIKLGPLLALTAGVGMTDGDRSEWLAAATDALRGVPRDLLERGIKAARQVADHPSKITPAIMAEIVPSWRDRRRDRGIVRDLCDLASATDDRVTRTTSDAGPACAPADVERMNRAMRKFGCRTRYRADGTDYQLAADAIDPADNTSNEAEPAAQQTAAA